MNMQLTEIMRLITNLIRSGTVSDVDPVNWLCRVRTGEFETNWINWLTFRAGKTRTWWQPSIGEQVVLLPEITGGRLSLFALEQIAELGRAWPLIEGSGTIYGMIVIESLSQTKADFFSNGVCRRIEFTLTLKRTDESLGEMFGSLSDQLSTMQGAATDAAGKVGAAVGGLFS